MDTRRAHFLTPADVQRFRTLAADYLYHPDRPEEVHWPGTNEIWFQVNSVTPIAGVYDATWFVPRLKLNDGQKEYEEQFPDMHPLAAADGGSSYAGALVWADFVHGETPKAGIYYRGVDAGDYYVPGFGWRPLMQAVIPGGGTNTLSSLSVDSLTVNKSETIAANATVSYLANVAVTYAAGDSIGYTTTAITHGGSSTVAYGGTTQVTYATGTSETFNGSSTQVFNGTSSSTYNTGTTLEINGGTLTTIGASSVTIGGTTVFSLGAGTTLDLTSQTVNVSGDTINVTSSSTVSVSSSQTLTVGGAGNLTINTAVTNLSSTTTNVTNDVTLAFGTGDTITTGGSVTLSATTFSMTGAGSFTVGGTSVFVFGSSSSTTVQPGGSLYVPLLTVTGKPNWSDTVGALVFDTTDKILWLDQATGNNWYGVPLTSAGTGGSGTVTSVALSDGSTTPIYTITGSPVTGSGTLTFTLATESANTVFAGPTSGGSAQPTFRALVAADLPGATTVSLGGTISSMPSTPTLYKITAHYTDFSSAGLSNTVNLVVVPAGTVFKFAKLKHSTNFTGGTIGTYTVSVGVSGGSSQAFLTAYDVHQAPGALLYATNAQSSSSTSQVLSHTATTTLTATATTTGDSTNHATQGAVDIWLELYAAT